jgi:hypothetical protein
MSKVKNAFTTRRYGCLSIFTQHYTNNSDAKWVFNTHLWNYWRKKKKSLNNFQGHLKRDFEELFLWSS